MQYVPTKFTIKYMKKEQSDILLQLMDGRNWDAKYCFGKIKVGWKKFAGDNKLKTGDVCVFELTKNKTLTLKVLIFRLEEPHFSSPQGIIQLECSFKVFSFIILLDCKIMVAHFFLFRI